MQPAARTLAHCLSLSLALALAAGASAPPARAEAYRWVDESGVTVYSQRPPPAVDSTQVRPAPQPSLDERRAAQERTRTQAEQDFDRREDSAQATGDPAQASADAAKEAQIKAAKAANCEAARKNLETLEKHGKGRLRTPDGKQVYLSKDELAGKKDEARAQIDTNCQ